MKVSALEEYGLRCMMQMSGSGPEATLSVHEIASREGLSDAYVAKLMNLLREGGLVDSVRGRSGGYYLTRPPHLINISEILRTLGGKLFQSEYCERFPGDETECVHLGDCSIRSLWGTVEGIVDQVLSRTTLADLMKSERRVRHDLLGRQRRSLPVLPDTAEPVPPLATVRAEGEDDRTRR